MKPTPACFIVAAVLLVSLLPRAVARTPAEGRVELRIKYGDDPRWAAHDLDDRDWKQIRSDEIPARTGPYWVRIRTARGWVNPRPKDSFWCEFLSWPDNPEIDSLFLAAVFSFDLYWDGRLLERSGTVGSSRGTEIPGRVDHIIRIPDDLRGPGEHVIALRMSSYGYNFPNAAVFTLALHPVANRDFWHYYSHAPIIPMMLLAGALVIGAISVPMLLFTERRMSLLLCHVLSLVLALFYGLIASVFLFNVPYNWFAPRYIAIAAIAGVISVLFPWLLAEHFGVLRRGKWLIPLAPMLVVAWVSQWHYENKALWMCRAMLLVSAGILAVAAWRRNAKALWLLPVPLAGIPLVQASTRLFLNPPFFIFLEALVFYVFASLGLRARTERQRARELTLTAARLETELLKRNIQPHFLLNTLATIIEMIEQAPKNAVALIEALASEFRILARVSGEKLIPLAQEIELCRSHLDIMSLRKGARCSLATHGIDGNALVPPALFHTLVENGLTHLMPHQREQTFELRATREPGLTRYVMLAHGVAHHSAGTVCGGTGTRYIKARLEESFPGRWSLFSEAIADGWSTVIEIKADASNHLRASPAVFPRQQTLEHTPA